jgi:hypothetical protein
MSIEKYEHCICFKCILLVEGWEFDCACDMWPIYGEKCNNCPKRSFCDVPANPELYTD